MDIDLSSSDIHVPHNTQRGLWAYSHDAEHDLMKRYVVETRTPSGWLGQKSFDDTDALADFLFNTSLPLGKDLRIFDQKLGRVL